MLGVNLQCLISTYSLEGNREPRCSYRAWVWFFVVCLLVGPGIAFATSNFRFTTLQDPILHLVGRPSATIQDSQGYIWFAGHGGLAKYDGYEFRYYTKDANSRLSLSSNHINDLYVDKQSQFWVLTNAGLNLYDPYKDDFERIAVLDSQYRGEAREYPIQINQVYCMLEDQFGSFWIGTGNGVFHYQPDQQTFTRFQASGESFSDALISTLLEDSNGDIWIGTNADGLFYYDPMSKKLTRYANDPVDEHSISSSSITVVYEDKRGAIWVGTQAGLNLFNRSKKQFIRYYHNPDNPKVVVFLGIDDILEDGQGNFWVLANGVNLFNREAGQFEFFYQDSYQNGRFGLHNNKAWTIYEGRDGNVWFGHFPSGISMLDRYASKFKIYQEGQGESRSLSNNDILAVDEDPEGNLWVGTENGLNYINAVGGTVTQYLMGEADSALPGKSVLDVTVDSLNRVWLGTWGGGLSRLDTSAGGFINYRKETSGPVYFDDKEVWKIYADPQNILWIGSEKGLSRYDPAAQKIERIKKLDGTTKILPSQITVIYEEDYNQFWLAGFDGVVRFNGRARTFDFLNSAAGADGLKGAFVNNITGEVSDRLWISTGGGAYLYESKTNAFKLYDKNSGLVDDYVSNTLVDNEGDVWFATRRGLSVLDSSTGSFRHFTKRQGLPGDVYRRPASMKLSNGKLVFGSNKGLVVFDPKELFHNDRPPEIVLTGFSLFNRDVQIGESGSPLREHISQAKEINLKYDQSVFAVEFSALNYMVSEENQYAYMLEGFDKSWNYVGGRRQAIYTNIDPGRYRLRIKAANNDGVWNEKGVSIGINVSPPWWKTAWAYIVYMIFMMTIVYLLYRYKMNSVELAQQRELNQLKDHFLASTTHELRTPLNGILGIVETMKSDMVRLKGDVHESTGMYLNIITASGKRLSNLINDILDSSKLQENKLDLIKSKVDLYNLVEQCFSILQFIAEEKNIDLVNEVPQNLPDIVADDARLEQVLINLLSNGIKYSDGGSVKVSASGARAEIKIVVKDTGIGIARQDLHKVFLPYEQIESADDKRRGGTGLGLPLAKSLVELHGGSISVESEVRQGSSFIILLPVNDEVALEEGPQIESKTLGGLALIADDDRVNRLILKNMLKAFNVDSEEVASGDDALEKYVPGKFNLIVLDVNMPGASGLEVCAKIRAMDARIPIIFISGNSSKKDIELALQAGAQTLIAKPIKKPKLKSALLSYL